MANPQKENGFTAISNELLEAILYSGLSGRDMTILFVVIRKTYGYRKKEDKLPLSQISSMTGITVSHVCRSLRFLKEKNIIKRDKKGNTSVQKDYEKWVLPRMVLPPAAVPPVVTATAARGNFATAARGTLKRKIQKKYIKRKMKQIPKGIQQAATTPKNSKTEISEPMNEAIDRSFPRKRLYGDEAFNWLLDFFEHKLSREPIDIEKWSRIYLKHLKGKIGLGKVREIIEWVADPDCWWYSRLTGFKMLYYKRDMILKAMEADVVEKKKNIRPYIDGDKAYQNDRGDWMIIPRDGGPHLHYVGDLSAIKYE